MEFGRKNISAGLFAMAFFMAHGFLLVFLRDFAPGKADWIVLATATLRRDHAAG